MLTVNLYKSIEDFCFEQKKLIQKNLYICPGPLIADGVRALIGSDVEVVTIAKWVNDQLLKNNQKRTGKAELLLRLSAVWRHYFPTSKEQIFFRAFETFTDLRSFTLEKDLLHEALTELDADLKKSIFLFWVYLENEKIIDEQLSYKLVSPAGSAQPLCFVGFKHMNAIQIDMLRLHSDFRDVSVAFPLDVYKETLATDWIRWLLPESSLEKLDQDNPLNIDVITFQKNRLNQYLAEYRKKQPAFDIIIPSAKINITQFQEVLAANLFFKSDLDLFDIEREKIFTELEKQDLHIDIVRAWLTGQKTASIELSNYCAFKICTMVEESLEIFEEVSLSLDKFHLSVMKEVVALNSPRNFLVPLCEDTSSRVLGLEEQRFEKRERPSVTIASSLYGPLSSKEKPYNEKMIAILSALGPLRRQGLDLLFVKETLQKVFEHKHAVLFLEEGLLDKDLSWREIFKNITLSDSMIDVECALKAKRDVVKEKIVFKKQDTTTLSASRLQTYIDCPRKYYFSYIEKLNIRPEIRLTLDPDEKGSLEHKIIADYLTRYAEYNYEKHFALCEHTFKDFLLQKQITLSLQLRDETFYELLEYTKNGITCLLNYKQDYKEATLLFEVPINDSEFGLKGFIDCVLKSGNEVHIFDFKRSSASMGTKKELLSFEKIQLWIYRWALKEKYQVAWWGYINLSDGSISGVKSEEAPSSNQFQDFLVDLVGRYNKEADFHPFPRSEKVCLFCDLQLFCPKERTP